MANLVTIGEYEDAVETAKGYVTEQQVDFTSGETKTAAFNASTRRIRVSADTDCRFRLGDGLTAQTNSQFLFANQTEYFTVDQGAGWVLSVRAA